MLAHFVSGLETLLGILQGARLQQAANMLGSEWRFNFQYIPMKFCSTHKLVYVASKCRLAPVAAKQHRHS